MPGGRARDCSLASRSGGVEKITVSLIGDGFARSGASAGSELRVGRIEPVVSPSLLRSGRALLEHGLPLQERVELLLELLLVEQLPAGDAVNLRT